MRRIDRRLLLRAIFAFAVAAYTVAALAHNWRPALPLAIAEGLVVCYVCFSSRWRQFMHWLKFLLPHSPRRQSTPTVRYALTFGTVTLHLVAILCLGARSLERWLPVLGMALLVLGCYAMSHDRQHIRWRPVCGGLCLQFWLAVLLLRTPIGLAGVHWAACRVQALLAHATVGAQFVFGAAISPQVWAFKVLPVTIFFASLSSVLLHLGALQFLFGEVGGALSAFLGTSRAEAICAVANIFLGQT